MMTNEEQKPEETNDNTPVPAGIKTKSDQDKNEGRQGLLKDLYGDKLHVVLLSFLYLLQNVPWGVQEALVLLLAERNVTLTNQFLLSISSYSYLMKLLYAPIIDSVYISRVGRRKTWLLPSQFLIGKGGNTNYYLTL